MHVVIYIDHHDSLNTSRLSRKLARERNEPVVTLICIVHSSADCKYLGEEASPRIWTTSFFPSLLPQHDSLTRPFLTKAMSRRSLLGGYTWPASHHRPSSASITYIHCTHHRINRINHRSHQQRVHIGPSLISIGIASIIALPYRHAVPFQIHLSRPSSQSGTTSCL